MRADRRPATIGLALAGGGPLGAIYEIGALCALQESLQGISLTRLDGYVGVSAGGILAAGLANGMTPRQMCAAFIHDGDADGNRIRPSSFMRPAWREFGRRAVALPGLVAQASWDAAFGSRSLLGATERLARALPSGVFDPAAVEQAVRRLLDSHARSNDFRQLQRRLIVVAADLDTGTTAPFGQPGWDDVPISQAVAASMALPGLFTPMRVRERTYVDGALKKTLHAGALLDLGVDLVLCLNPLVPFVGGSAAGIPRLADGGLPTVMSQTLRSLIHSRLEPGLRGYARSHPQATVLLFEPQADDPTLFGAPTFGYRGRRALAEHAYQITRADLRRRRHELAPTLATHGITLIDAVLDDPGRRLVPAATPVARHLNATLDALDGALAGRQADR